MNFIDNLPSTPSWVGWLVLGLALAAFIAFPMLYAWTKRRAFTRDRASVWQGSERTHRVPEGYGPSYRVMSEWRRFCRVSIGEGVGSIPWIWVYLVRDGEQPTDRAAALLAEGWRPGGTTVWGVTAPRLRYEYGMAWLTRLLKGAGPVYEIAVREKPGDPEGAHALAHELAHHVWPHLHGLGWNRNHAWGTESPDGRIDAVASIEAKLIEGLKA